uniref:Uncharacterized protein n=1 Tax=Oryza nivara TaxID=4536 RepID=A0A1Y8Z5J6_ORYNI
MVPYIQR